ncbi:MAG: hypothetical protein ACRELD_14095 [Longimicrobiales bacterium]
MIRFRRWCHAAAAPWPSALALALVLVTTVGCGGHRLGEFAFTGRTLAVVYSAAPAPYFGSSIYDVGGAADPVGLVLAAGSRAAKEIEGRRARGRLDSAASRVDVAGRMAAQTAERASRYLGTRPTRDARAADYLLELDVRRIGIEAPRGGAAYMVVRAEAVLIEARTGHEIWREEVRGWDRLTPLIVGAGSAPRDAVTAGVLHTLAVEDLQRILERLADYSSDVIADGLRADLRAVRRGS